MKISNAVSWLFVSLSFSTLVSSLPTSNTLHSNQDFNQDQIQPLQTRDAYTNLRSNSSDVHLTGMGTPPKGAYVKTIEVVKGGEIPTWYSEAPKDESKAESAFIIVHGKLRNANSYFTVLNNVYTAATGLKLGSAAPNSILVAPQFFSELHDKGAYNATTLAWGDTNAWSGGDASTFPKGLAISSFQVLDALLARFSDKQNYPKMKTISFVAHGGGAQLVQRYAVMGNDNPDTSRLSVRYIVGDPSSMLYFTRDRPVAVDVSTCPTFNEFRYGLDNYRTPYPMPFPGNPAALFSRYAQREVRYVVGLDDVSTKLGDQQCPGRAVGGAMRKNRSLAYWRYIHLLSGQNVSDTSRFPGQFPALEQLHKYADGNRTATVTVGENGQVSVGLDFPNNSTNTTVIQRSAEKEDQLDSQFIGSRIGRIARAMNLLGPRTEDRTHHFILSGTTAVSSLNTLSTPVNFTSTSSPATSPYNVSVPVSDPKDLVGFTGVNITHSLATVSGVGHNAAQVLSSKTGMAVLFLSPEALNSNVEAPQVPVDSNRTILLGI